MTIYNHGETKSLGIINELRITAPVDNTIVLLLETIPTDSVALLRRQTNITKVTLSKEKVLQIYPNDGNQVLTELLSLLEINQLTLEKLKKGHTKIRRYFVYFMNEHKMAGFQIQQFLV